MFCQDVHTHKVEKRNLTHPAAVTADDVSFRKEKGGGEKASLPYLVKLLDLYPTGPFS